MATKIMYTISHDPKEEAYVERVSEAFAQALTALSFSYECAIFLTSGGVNIAKKGHVEGAKAPTFEPVSVMLENSVMTLSQHQGLAA